MLVIGLQIGIAFLQKRVNAVNFLREPPALKIFSWSPWIAGQEKEATTWINPLKLFALLNFM